jgi:hypothetical protein
MRGLKVLKQAAPPICHVFVTRRELKVAVLLRVGHHQIVAQD